MPEVRPGKKSAVPKRGVKGKGVKGKGVKGKGGSGKRRVYRCGKCGQPKKGHTCTALDSERSAAPTPLTPPTARKVLLSTASSDALAEAWAAELSSGESEEESGEAAVDLPPRETRKHSQANANPARTKPQLRTASAKVRQKTC